MRNRAAYVLLLLAASCRTGGGGFEPIEIDLRKPTPSPTPSAAPSPAATPTAAPAPAAARNEAASPAATPTAVPTPAAAAPAVSRPTRAETSAPERVVQEQLEAYNRHDLEAFLNAYSEDARVLGPAGEILFSGIDQIRQRYARRFAESPSVRATVSRRLVEGPYVVDQEELTGLEGGRSKSALLVYRVEDGKITRVWLFD